MSKIDIDSVEHTMLSIGIAQVEVQKVIDDLKKQLEELAALKEKKEKIEKIKYVLVNTSNFTGDVSNLPATMVEAADDVAWHSVVDEIIAAGKEANNDVKKLHRDPVKSVFDAVERVPAKFFKARKIRIISKDVTQILQTDNVL